MLLARACGAALLAPADSTLAAPALAATQFLVDASALPHGESQIRRSFADRMVWLAELYSRQADRDYRHNRHGLGEHSAGAH